MSKLIKVYLDRQIIEGFESNKRVFVFDCVTGDRDHPTDRGLFHILRKLHPYRSKKYNVPMNYALFFTQDGKALHQYHGPLPLSMIRSMRAGVSDWFGSHGCVRLDEEDARALWEWADYGTTVQVQ